jgi:hypothetical protein
MARMEALNGGSDLRAHLARTPGSGSLLEVEAWMPSEVKAISPLVDRLMRLIEGRIASRARNPPSKWRFGKLSITQSFMAIGWMPTS